MVFNSFISLLCTFPNNLLLILKLSSLSLWPQMPRQCRRQGKWRRHTGRQQTLTGQWPEKNSMNLKNVNHVHRFTIKIDLPEQWGSTPWVSVAQVVTPLYPPPDSKEGPRLRGPRHSGMIEVKLCSVDLLGVKIV